MPTGFIKQSLFSIWLYTKCIMNASYCTETIFINTGTFSAVIPVRSVCCVSDVFTQNRITFLCNKPRRWNIYFIHSNLIFIFCLLSASLTPPSYSSFSSNLQMSGDVPRLPFDTKKWREMKKYINPFSLFLQTRSDSKLRTLLNSELKKLETPLCCTEHL